MLRFRDLISDRPGLLKADCGLSRLRGIVIAMALLATAASTFRVYPHQLAYFNELAGGPPNGYRHLLDSNLEWGQDLLALQKISAPSAKAWINVCGLEEWYPPHAQYLSVDAIANLAEFSETSMPALTPNSPAASDGVLMIGVSALMQRELDSARARILENAERIEFTILLIRKPSYGIAESL